MITNLIIFIFIIILFIALLILKKIISMRVCVLCMSISFTWLILLLLYKLNYFHDNTILALLMGQSITGIYYLLEKKLTEKFYVFKLPFILTLTFLFYFIISYKNILSIFIGLLFLWSVSYLIYSGQKSNKLKLLAKQLIECCKNW